MLVFADLMPDCRLEVSLHWVGPATGQCDRGVPWFSLVPEQMLSWFPNSTLRCMLTMVALETSHCTNVISKYGDLTFGVGGSDTTAK
jgi:hypothetical protein